MTEISLPLGVSTQGAPGLELTVIHAGRDGGADISVHGLPERTAANQMLLAPSAAIAARHGERCQVATRTDLLAGSLDHVTRVEIVANLNDAEGRYSSWLDSSATLRLAAIGENPMLARLGTSADRRARYLQPLVQIGTLADRAVDLTLRISLPIAERLDHGPIASVA